MSLIRQVKGKWFPINLPSEKSFDGKTVVVTGGTSGLGLAAAVHFACLGAKEVIITCRKASRGEAARQQITSVASAVGRDGTSISVMELDMDRYSSCVAFVDNLKRTHGSRAGDGAVDVDVVVLNAGVIAPNYVQSPEGWDENIQVNTLSAVLIALLLLPVLKARGTNHNSPPRMVFVGSGRHAEPEIADWPKFAREDGGILAHFNKPENQPQNNGPDAMYPIVKLFLHYAYGELAKLALGPGGEVIMTSVCPGIVNTGLARGVKQQSVAMKVLVPIFLGILGKSADYGARFLVNAAVADEKDHGRFFRYYLSDEEYQAKAVANFTSDIGKEVQELVWKEIAAELRSKVPSLRAQPGDV